MKVKKYIFIGILILMISKINAQEVPKTIMFCGIELKLTNDLRDKIKKEVENLTINQKYFNRKVERANTYLPLIEKVFYDQNFPLDFKYLAIQESGLVSDAVSSSNAVGYWQFKRPTAMEVGMKVNDQMDERKHIIESTKGAAKYLKRHYGMFNNWVYCLIAYNTGAGGVKKHIEKKYLGADKMKLDSDLHWYAVTFFAHYIAFRNEVEKNTNPDIQLIQYKEARGKKLKNIAKEAGVKLEKLKKYNKWLKTKRIPDDTVYTVIVPAKKENVDAICANLNIEKTVYDLKIEEKPGSTALAKAGNGKTKTNKESKKRKQQGKDDKEKKKDKKGFFAKVKDFFTKDKDKFEEKNEIERKEYDKVPIFLTYNGLEAIQAQKGDDIASLAYVSGIDIDDIRKYNDMKPEQEVEAGDIYYLEKKNKEGMMLRHIVKPGQTLWEVSQEQGIRLEKLMEKNRIKSRSKNLQTGRMLYLKNERPEGEDIIIKEKYKKENKKNEEEEKVAEKKKGDKVYSGKDKNSKNNSDSISIKSKEKQNINAKSQKELREAYQKKNSKGTNAYIKDKKSLINNKSGFDSSYYYHVVLPDQTLYSLSQYYNTTIEKIKAWNNLDNNQIKYGQLLIVRKKSNSLNKNFRFHTVVLKNSLDRIADKYNVSVKEIMKWNDKSNKRLIKGEQLKIKKK